MEFNQNKELLSNTLALNVALQTIKERCVHLQKRLYTLESENSQLRLNTINSNSDKRHESRRDNSLVSELEELRAKNAELNLQKNQLTENLSMISTENRKLWQRLSHLTKENVDEAALLKGNCNDSGEKEEEQGGVTGKHANLIRSKTFTQNSPHQLLREKIAGNHIGPIDGDLEDISLINDCDFATATQTHQNEGATLEQDDTDIDTRTCTEGLLNIKRELLKQNSDLKVALSNWRKFKNSDMCSCKTKCDKNNKKPLMIDKSLETERDLVTLDFLVDQDSPNNNNFDITKRDHVLVDLIEKKKADLAEKICPMCGKFYKQNILFEEFLEHVESHFSGSDSELSLEHNFELVSHSVGNF
ncbi:hypothetical protein PVAND_001326 [Polypedilum vanderplanki]|uniref:UBZ1-type domain-containing protein n=1 Tax=Polypedilum vanderplanki TaxID=319348 RepID=A0A9J6BN15_POLVA|nr:hypothetical protein PVAND_001326 [Polypedilum vanderplanki]